MTQTEGAGDFDFLHGSWRVDHRRLKERLADCDQWEQFGGSMECRPVLGGLGNVDDNLIELPAGAYRAVTIRWFDPTEKRWTIHWIDGRTPALDAPMIGSFRDGVGTFFGDDELRGRPVMIRFLWDRITESSARWQQAFAWPGSD
ncbi:MAG TPA: DUF1579 domain-containing protein, partial [Sphingomicrobium sp.]